MSAVPSIFVAATRQHVGKTSVSLALLSGLMKRFDKVGFMKPVGQTSLSILTDTGETVMIDKDAALAKKQFQLDHVPWECISPVLIPGGYTRDYLDGNPEEEYSLLQQQQKQRIQTSYAEIASRSDVVLCEGTGHTAVGSVVDASNADVASWLETPMVLVVNGGIGRAVDELSLNYTYCKAHNVPIAGVVVNQVLPEKYDQTVEYLQKAFQHKGWNMPILGTIPDRPFLGYPCLTDLETLLDGRLLTGRAEHALRHYQIRRDLHLVACSLEIFLQRLRQQRISSATTQHRRSLFVCHASRNDILLGLLMEAVQNNTSTSSWQSSLIVTGCAEHPLSAQVLEIVSALQPRNAPPVLMTPHATDVVLEKLYSYTAKLNIDDETRVDTAVQHYEPYIDFDLLLERVERLSGRTTATGVRVTPKQQQPHETVG
jgi:BioD-like phosphotransacetylase family protein